MKAIIMAGGLGMRLRPLTKILPKPLLPLGDKSIIEITINKLDKEGFDEIILATNYKSDLFQQQFKDNKKITISKENEPLGTAGPLKLLYPKLKAPFLVINGDILTNIRFSKVLKFHNDNNADMTIVTKKIEFRTDYGMIQKRQNKIYDLKEKPVISTEAVGGIYIINPDLISMIPNGHFDMTDLIKLAVYRNMNVLAYEFNGYWMDIGQIGHYQQATKDWNNK